MEQINSNKKHSNRRKYFSLLAVVLFIAFSGAYAYWSMELEDMISTDDAYVTGNADPISAQVSGSVTVVNHKDNIVRQTNKLYLQDKQYSAEVASARIQYQQSLEDYNRRVPLAKQGVISKETLEHTKDTLISSKAALNAAIQAYKANKALVMNTPLNRQPQVNFKETQLTDVRIGQSVNIISDLYGENVVFHGRVTGINMGTGNAFSLLPAQNATGNWIKIVQRVPVEVSLDPKELMEHPLRIGLSMTATIDTKNEDIAEMPELASTVTSMPAYTSKALVIDTSPIEKEISNIISHNGQF
ncbi:MAG: HlyD family secretion protein [Escherichia coli]|nr:HlyD family secretion protein [Escherichia coli]